MSGQTHLAIVDGEVVAKAMPSVFGDEWQVFHLLYAGDQFRLNSRWATEAKAVHRLRVIERNTPAS
jgi:hypothetical protein